MRCVNYAGIEMRIGILGSTRGTHLAALHDALQDDIKIVISNKADAGILQRAKERNLNTLHILSKGLTREAFDAQVTSVLEKENVELIVLIGYMRILSSSFVNHWQNKIINVHPSLLPLHAGLMDLQVHQAVLDAKENQTGCTVHYVIEEVDAGPVILQKRCKVLEDDTAANLKARVQSLESAALIEAIKLIRT